MIRPELDGVPETTLWTLWARAQDAARGGRLQDPKALEIVDALDFDFAARFGTETAAFARLIGMRALMFDSVVLSILREDPAATVVVLGEGLETQFWRVDNGTVRWLTVELPSTAAVREALLPADPPRRRLLAGSALDLGWFDEVGSADRVVVIAQGLLMYLPPAEVRRLILACAARFPGGVMAFDTVPPWFSALSVRGRLKQPGGYEAPPMPWGVDTRRLRQILRARPTVADVSIVDPPGFPAPLRGAYAVVRHVPLASAVWPGVVRVDFAR
ncbi:MAG: class I SAM-dependent methyltransferase [Sporichthyaceae bacterium]